MTSNQESVTFKDVSFVYKGSERKAIENINLGVEKGKIILISGPAGAGKTTLCRCINGLIPLFYSGKLRGSIFVNGVNTDTYARVGELSSVVGYVAQDPTSQLFCPTVEDEVSFGLENQGLPREKINNRIDKYLELTRIEKYRDKSPLQLSGGEQQACAIAAFLAMEPEILILDEPTSNIDPIGSKMIFELVHNLIKGGNRASIIVEHKMEALAPIADLIVIMNKGKLTSYGKPRDVLEKASTLLEIGLKPPQVTLLAEKLREIGIRFCQIPLTVEEMAESLLKIFKEKNIKQGHPKRMKETYIQKEAVAIQTKNLWHTYEDGTVALKDVSLLIREGDFMGIIGQNGSGKTTLVKHFNGLLKPTQGSVTVFGRDTIDLRPDELAQTVGYCFQNPDNQIFCGTVREEIAFGPTNIGLSKEEIEQRVLAAARRVEIDHYLDEDPFSLSLGERLRVAVASVLAMRPRILVVDEPTTGQDYKRGRAIMELMRELNETGSVVIVITHDISLCAEYVKRTIVMKDGRIILDGSSREVFSQVDALRKTYLEPPQVTLLGQKLKDYLPSDALTVDETYNHIVNLLSR